MTDKITTIQLTSKRLKLHKLISWTLIVFGIGVILFNQGQDQVVARGALVALAGFIWLGVTRFRIWWNHK